MSDTYNQDPEQDQTPPTLQSALAAPQAGGIQDDGSQPAGPQTGGMPDMGPAPEIAQDTLGQGVSKFADAAGSAIGRGWQNLKDSYPGQAAQAVGRGITDAVAGTANPAAPAGSEPAQPGAKRIASMLLGDSAAPPETLDQMKQTVDPRNSQPPGNQNLMAVDAAYQKGGPKAAWPIVQANRVAFNAKQAFAYTAANGINGKPADINAAVNAANEAEQHVLDGSNVEFSHGQSGQITATVTPATGGAPQTIPLTADQFKAYLDVGKDGQWDKLMDKTVPNTLLQIAKQNNATMAPSAKGAPQPDAGDKRATSDPSQDSSEAEGAKINTDAGPNTKNYSSDPWAKQFDAANDTDNHSIEARANRIFGANDASTRAAREQWISAQEESQAKRDNEVAVAREKGIQANKRAEIQGGHHEAGEKIKADAGVQRTQISTEGKKYVGDKQADARRASVQAELAKRASIEKNADRRNAAAVLGHQLNNIALLPADQAAEVEKRVDAFMAAGVPTGQAAPAPTGKAAAPPTGAAQRPPGVSQDAKLFNGKWYTRGPNGESVLAPGQ